MRLALAIALCAVSGSAVAQTASFQIHGFLTAREISVMGQPSWTDGGFGRFDVGASGVDDRRLVNIDLAQLGLDWTPAKWLLVHADGIARQTPSEAAGRRAGLIQAYVDIYNDQWRLRAGAFWLPTSRENVDPMWNSRYTITYSALNTWIGEEVRPVGVDLQYSPNFYVSAGATAFRGNDTMGTELSARGWTFGNRLSVYSESLPLPPPSITTMPVGRDLDGRNGYSERIRLQLPERASIRVTHIDNRAELVPEIDGEVPWETRFNIVSADVGASGPTTLAAEWASGTSAVVFPGGSFTLNFSTAYLLVSHKMGADRFSARVEQFATSDHDHPVPDLSRERGHAFTVAWMHDLYFRQHSPDTPAPLRTGLEYVWVKGDHPGASAVGFDPRTGGSTITLELRYGF